MAVEVDQSGKIEDTSVDTVLAASNSEKYTVILSAKDKRRLQEKFRLYGKRELFVYSVFSIALYYLLKKYRNKSIVIDIEYSGKTNIIREMLDRLGLECNFQWKSIGKNSLAHDLAYKTFKGKLAANQKLLFEEVWKKGKKITGGYLKIGLSPTNRHSAPVTKKYDITKR